MQHKAADLHNEKRAAFGALEGAKNLESVIPKGIPVLLQTFLIQQQPSLSQHFTFVAELKKKILLRRLAYSGLLMHARILLCILYP